MKDVCIHIGFLKIKKIKYIFIYSMYVKHNPLHQHLSKFEDFQSNTIELINRTQQKNKRVESCVSTQLRVKGKP